MKYSGRHCPSASRSLELQPLGEAGSSTVNVVPTSGILSNEMIPSRATDSRHGIVSGRWLLKSVRSRIFHGAILSLF